MADSVALVRAIVLIALAFDFINGFHDSANSIATVVSTRVLSPTAAVVWAAFFNFAAVFIFGTAVAKNIAKGIVDPAVVDASVILAGLVGAISWNLITWYAGRSEEHTSELQSLRHLVCRLLLEKNKG